MSDMGSLFGMSGDEIYRNFRQGAGAEGLSTSASTLNELVVRYQQRAERLAQLRSRMEAGWQGTAADAAHRGLGPAVDEHEKAGEALFTAEELTIEQAGSFDNAKNSVMRVPPEPAKVDPLSLMLNPEGQQSFWDQTAERQQAAQHNVDVMNTYSTSSEVNTDGQPDTFGELVGDQSTVEVSGPDSGGSIDSDDYRESTSDSVPPDSAPWPGSSGDAAPPATDSDLGTNSGASNGTATDATTPGGYTATPSPVGATTPQPGSDTGAGLPRGTSGGGFSTGLGIPLDGRGVGLGGPRGGAGLEAPRGGQAGAPGRVAPGAVTSTGPGRGGMGFGGMPVGGGRGRGEEDTERKTPAYLEGGDPEELFDTDLLTAPPAIGGEDD